MTKGDLEWELGRPLPFAKVFRQEGTFVALHAAEKYCEERGFSVGRVQREAPIGIRLGDYDIQKWRNLRSGERGQLDGVIVGDKRNGPVTVYRVEKPDA